MSERRADCLNHCTHPEISKGEYIVEDKIGGAIFHLCEGCFEKIKHLTGYRVISRPKIEPPKTRLQKMRELKDVPF